MSAEVPEAEWKYFRKVSKTALQVLCQRILDEIEQVSRDGSKTAHERYLEIFKLIRKRDDDIAIAFNDMRRSVFYQQLASIRYQNLLTDEQWNGFSEATRQRVEGLIEILHPRRTSKRK
jgi:hypothetical protein